MDLDALKGAYSAGLKPSDIVTRLYPLLPLRLAYSSLCCLSKICWHVAGAVLQHSPVILAVMEH